MTPYHEIVGSNPTPTHNLRNLILSKKILPNEVVFTPFFRNYDDSEKYKSLKTIPNAYQRINNIQSYYQVFVQVREARGEKVSNLDKNVNNFGMSFVRQYAQR